MTMTRHMMRLLAAGALAVLAACTGGDEQFSDQASAIEQVRQYLQAGNAETAPEITVTRALLNQLTVPSLEIVAESSGQKAFLVPFSRRGTVTIWRTAMDGQVVLRQGLVTATRGLGGDLTSSDYAQPLTALQRRAGTYQRRLYFNNSAGGQSRLTLSCTLSNLGPKRLEVVERSYNTHHLRETCMAGQDTITNAYWIETSSGILRKSRQWVGPHIGYLNLRLLKSASE